MYCRVLACDFDGTGASDGHLAPEVAHALQRARAAGYTTLLVTGRVLDDLRIAHVDFSAFDAVVAENGAVLWLPSRDRTMVLAEPPPEHFLGRLRDGKVPFHVGAVVIGTWDGYAAQVLALIRETGVDLQLVFNRAAVMLLPSGVNKATGVQRALDELGRSPRNMVAFGDAENDLPLFAQAEVAVAARGAVPAAAALADDRLSHPGAAGVAHFVHRVLDEEGHVPTPPRRHLLLGRSDDGAPVVLPAGVGNVLVSGDPRAGKSWLAGLVAERLVEAGYRVCVFDPEGDHAELAQRPGVLRLGGALALPAAGAIAAVARTVRSSLVLDLGALAPEAKCAWVTTAIAELACERARSGLPHWMLVDEAHYFFRPGQGCDLAARTGNLLLVTYRPSLIDAEVLPSIGAFLLTRTTVEDERYFVDGLLRTHGPAGLDASRAVSELQMPRAGLLVQTAAGPRWQTFVPHARLSPHVHHARKYANVGVPPERAFAFRRPQDGILTVAHNVEEFHRALATVPLQTLRHHLVAGDFSRWVREVLGDVDLAAGLSKLEHTTRVGAPPSRDELLQHVRDRYVL